MSIQVVHARSVSYTENGATDYRDESYIKILTSFRDGALRELQNAPLSVFLCVALHEGDETPGCSLSTIQDETGYSRPTVTAALKFLLDLAHQYLQVVGARPDGTKIYRVAAYAWFGKAGVGKKLYHPPEKLSPVVVDESIQNQTINSKQQTTSAARKILLDCGILGKPLNVLSETVSEETARLWFEWLKTAPDYLRNPVGVIVNTLLADPDARPPVKPKKEEPARRKPSISGPLAPKQSEETE